MKLTVKTLKGTHFQLVVQPSDTVMAVKKQIEEVQGKDNYPCGQQLLIYTGKVLKDESTLEESKVGEDGFIVVMLSKSKPSSAVGSSSATQPPSVAQANPPAPIVAQANPPAPIEAPRQAMVSTDSTSSGEIRTTGITSNAYDQAASNLVAETNLEPMVQQLMDMGGGTWNKDTVLRALRAAFNNPERAVEYLYSGIPEAAEVAVPVAPFLSNQASTQGPNATQAASTAGAGASPLSGLPNSSPLNMFPEEIPSTGAGAGVGSLDFLRNNQQFQMLRAMVQANPQILQPMLQELSRQNPQMLRLIQEHNAEFLQLLNEPVESVEGDLSDQPEEEMPHAINVTPAEQEAIERLEAMGFDRAHVIEAFLACDRDEELAANYLLEHAGDDD